MPRTRVLLALVLLALTTLCGCTGPPPAARARGSAVAVATVSAVPPPPALDLTREELLAALPLACELFPWRVQVRCSAKAACTELDDGRGRAAYLEARGAESRGLPDYLLIAGVRWRDAAQARQAVRTSRGANEDDYSGAFDRRPVRLGEGRYRYGLHGHGRVTPVDVSGWAGYRRVLTLRLERLDGVRSAPFHDVFVHLGRGRYAVEVEVRALATRTGRESARAQADEQLAALLARLEELGRSERSLP